MLFHAIIDVKVRKCESGKVGKYKGNGFVLLLTSSLTRFIAKLD